MEPSNGKDILEALASFWIPFLIVYVYVKKLKSELEENLPKEFSEDEKHCV